MRNDEVAGLFVSILVGVDLSFDDTRGPFPGGMILEKAEEFGLVPALEPESGQSFSITHRAECAELTGQVFPCPAQCLGWRRS